MKLKPLIATTYNMPFRRYALFPSFLASLLTAIQT
jgi:hypothetical protein